MIGAATLAGLVVVLFGAATGAMNSHHIDTGTGLSPASWGADVPEEMGQLYADASFRFGIPAPILAAVGKIECDHNRLIDGPSAAGAGSADPAERSPDPDAAEPFRRRRCDRPNEAGAQGPMQFLPSTFARWSWASGSERPSIIDPTDAVFAAAAKLHADGVVADPVTALWAYNHSYSYVADVLAWAVVYGWRPPTQAPLATAVLHHRRIALRPAAAADVEAGRVDGRVLAVLLSLATRHDLASVGPFASGHSPYVRDSNGRSTGRYSNHHFGRAVDIPTVDRQGVRAGNGHARQLVLEALSLPHDIRPTEVLSPWELRAENGARSHTNAAHATHVHLGFDADSQPRKPAVAR